MGQDLGVTQPGGEVCADLCVPPTQPHQFGALVPGRAELTLSPGRVRPSGMAWPGLPSAWAVLFASPRQGSGQATSMECRAHFGFSSRFSFP